MDLISNISIRDKNLLVKHTLRTDLKGVLTTTKALAYPIYVLISYEQTVFQFRSRYLDFYVTPTSFRVGQQAREWGIEFVRDAHLKELELVIQIIEMLGEGFSRPTFKRRYEFFTKRILTLLNREIKEKKLTLLGLAPYRFHFEALSYFAEYENLSRKELSTRREPYFYSVFEWYYGKIRAEFGNFLSEYFQAHKVNHLVSLIDEEVEQSE